MGKRNDPKRRAELARAAERRRKVWEMRRNGVALPVIARMVGVSTKTAWLDLQRVLAELRPPEEDLEAFRTLESGRLEAVRERLWTRFEVETKKRGGGDAHAIASLARGLVRVSESVRRLHGADKPVPVDLRVEGTVGVEVDGTLEITAEDRTRQAKLLLDEARARALLPKSLGGEVDDPVPAENAIVVETLRAAPPLLLEATTSSEPSAIPVKPDVIAEGAVDRSELPEPKLVGPDEATARRAGLLRPKWLLPKPPDDKEPS